MFNQITNCIIKYSFSIFSDLTFLNTCRKQSFFLTQKTRIYLNDNVAQLYLKFVKRMFIQATFPEM